LWQQGVYADHAGSSPNIELSAVKMVKIECWTLSGCYGMHFGPFPKSGYEAGPLSGDSTN
jgi:hypothetical protein